MAGTGRKVHDSKEILSGDRDDRSARRREIQHDRRFLRRVEQARNSLRAGQGVNLDDLEIE